MAEGETLIIGAGPAGLASAYHLQRRGLPYRMVDRAGAPASTWAKLYPSLQLNTARFVSHLPGRRMPLRYKIYPMGWQLHEYLVDYARWGGFPIEFGVEVKRVAPDAGMWWAETSAWAERFTNVIIASGRFSSPYMPPIDGQETYTGRLLHASDYRSAAEFAGQRVVVVGSGPSGGDIAAELGETAAHPVILAVRSDMVIARMYPFGLPETAWRIALMALPKGIRTRIMDRIAYMGFPQMRQIAARYGVVFAPNRVDRAGSSAPVRGRALVDAMMAGRVRPSAGLARLRGLCAELMDGTSVAADAVILCTGYRPAIGYLDFPYEVDRDGWLRRISDKIDDSVTEAAGFVGLYQVGRYYRGLGPLRNIRAEAKDAAERIAVRRAISG